MHCIILGCGGSLGVPQLLCKCKICLSNNPKNIRMRASILIQSETTNVIVDLTPDFKQQILNNNINGIDAVLFTHMHSDHISGINDLLPFTFSKPKINTYMTKETYNGIAGSYEYLFDNNNKSIYRSILTNNFIDFYQKFEIGDISVQTFKQYHGSINSMGFRFNGLAYSTDFNSLPNESYRYLEDLDIWIIDFLKYSWSPSHLSYEGVFELIDKFKPKRVVFTHMTHKIDYDELKNILPNYIEPGFDKMILNF